MPLEMKLMIMENGNQAKQIFIPFLKLRNLDIYAFQFAWPIALGTLLLLSPKGLGQAEESLSLI